MFVMKLKRRHNTMTIYSVDMGGGKSSCVVLENLSPTLTCTHYGEPAIAYETDFNRASSERFQGDDNGSLPDTESEDGNRRRKRASGGNDI